MICCNTLELKLQVYLGLNSLWRKVCMSDRFVDFILLLVVTNIILVVANIILIALILSTLSEVL